MGVLKDTLIDNIPASYHRVTRMNIDLLNEKIKIEITSFENQEAFTLYQAIKDIETKKNNGETLTDEEQAKLYYSKPNSIVKTYTADFCHDMTVSDCYRLIIEGSNEQLPQSLIDGELIWTDEGVAMRVANLGSVGVNTSEEE